MDGAVTTPESRTLRWAIIMTRLLILPTVIEVLTLGWAILMLAIEPRMFSGYGAIVFALCVIAGLHGAFSAAGVLIGWRMSRRRNLGAVPRRSATVGAVLGFIYFFSPLLFVLIEPDAIGLWIFVGVISLFTWPALVCAVLCIRLRRHAPAKDAALEEFPDPDTPAPGPVAE